MPMGHEFQKEVVNAYLRGQTPITIATVYKAQFQSATADVAAGTITCSAAAVGAAEVTIAGINDSMTADSLVRFSGDTTRVYQIRETLTADGALKIHPPLQVAVTASDTVEFMRESNYSGYSRPTVTYDAPGDHGDTDTSADVVFPAVTGLSGNNQLDANAGALKSAATGGMIITFGLFDPRKLLDNGDKCTISTDNDTFTWAYN
jgi:hypothetical protein